MNKKYLIINADDFGMCHSANMAIKNLLSNHYIKSSTIIVNSSWSNEAFALAKEFDDVSIGVHINHTSEWENYRWRPLTDDACLRDNDGFFYKDTASVFEFCTTEAKVKEAKAQIDYAIHKGIKISHIDNHMETMANDLKSYIDLAKEYHCCLRLPKASNTYEINEYAKKQGVLTPDYLNPNILNIAGDRENIESLKDAYRKIFRNLPLGISEFFTHPALESDELKAIAPDWKVRVADYEFFSSDEFKRICLEENITLIGYHELIKIK